jgi:ABC-type iron transport system FetAB permease component
MAMPGYEKAQIARWGSAVTSVLTGVAVFVAPASTAGHIIALAILVAGSAATALGVELTTNSGIVKVTEQVISQGLAVAATLLPSVPDWVDVNPFTATDPTAVDAGRHAA